MYTVVTVLHDSAEPLAALLASLRRLPRVPPVVAVDTGSADDGPALARAHGAAVVDLPGNPGFGAASNAGVARVTTPATVLLNPDCEVAGSALEDLAARAVARDALWAPRLVAPDGRVERSAHPRPGTLAALLPAVLHPRVLPEPLRLRADPWRAGRPRRVGWAVAACLAARTATLRRLGPFDPAQFLFYEDLDLCLRGAAAGIPTLLEPGISVRHRGAHSTRRAYGGEPHALLARRRRAVVGANLGAAARVLDDAAQATTFATRALARSALRRDARRERAQLAAVLGAIRGDA